MRSYKFTQILALFPLLAAALPATPSGNIIKLTKRIKLTDEEGSVNFNILHAEVLKETEKIQRGVNAYMKNTGVKWKRKRDTGAVPLDAQDGLWEGIITVGTPPSQYKIDFDTGSSDLVLPGANCNVTCDGHTRYDPSKSSTSTFLNHGFRLTYGDGSNIQGLVYADTVSVGGIEVTNQALGVAQAYSSGLSSDNFAPDGLMGMGFSQISAFNSPFFENAINQGKPSNGVFAFKLADTGSELYLGGTNEDLYTGSFTYAPLTKIGFWEVAMDALYINGKDVVDNLSAIIDTGTTLVIGDEGNVAKLYSQVSGAKKMNGKGGYYTFPCDSVPSVSLQFGGKAFPISTETFNLGRESRGSSRCVGGIVYSGSLPDNSWVIGDVFLKSVYTVFDMSSKRVGFATLA